jgi:HSP20 family protein
MDKQKFGESSENEPDRSYSEIQHINSKQNNWQIFSHSQKWHPPTDVFETIEGIIIRVDISGMTEKDIDITINKNIININGIRLDDIKEKIAFHQMEVNFGEFNTSIAINVPIQIEKAEAKYINGMLIITLPKSKQISISINK